ncbi:MAG: hypothetical protein IPG96_18390 [Proteobacteria bacterium]|nr:hypothetical protein [Pseudomonadota bacterium]
MLLPLAAASGCFKVEHLGEATGRATDRAFRTQALPSEEIFAQPKAMEAELAAGAVKAMTSDNRQQNARGKTTLLAPVEVR